MRFVIQKQLDRTGRIKLSKQARLKQVGVYFNNTLHAYAVSNALTLKSMI